MNLLAVEKPARYMGDEMGSVRKDSASLRIALAFPDVYEVGMSHLGLRILYQIINAMDDVAAERVYAPWPDMERQMEQEGVRLATLETATPLAECGVVAFTLQYELSYTNILNMLRLAGIPLLATERDASHPLLLGGGTVSFYGPLVGSLIFVVAQELLSAFWEHWMLLYGLSFVIIILVLPTGLMGILKRK